MNSQIIRGKIWHRRRTPKVHNFTYPACTFALDLDELANLRALFPLLGINRFGIYCIRERDYLGGGEGTLKERLLARSAESLALTPDSKIILLTMPRLLGYVFNPVNFYLILDASSRVQALVSEVQNTFGEAHLYCSKLLSRDADGRSYFQFPKEFYVSPFIEVKGDYEISIAPYTDKLDLAISLHQDNELRFAARLWGQGRPFSTMQLARTLVTRPLVGVLAMSRIHLQGLLLYFFKSAHVAEKPTCPHHNTFRVQPSWLHKLRLRILAFAAHFRHAEEQK